MEDIKVGCRWCRWGVAGQRGVVYVEDFDGRVGVMTQIEDLDAVAAALDRRGVRELALSTAIDKTYKYADCPLHTVRPCC